MPNIIDLTSERITGALADQPLYQVPNAGMKVLESVINATWTLGNLKSDEAYTKMRTATQTGGFLDIEAVPSVTAGTIGIPSVAAPNVAIPENIDTSQILSTFGSQYQELVTMLSGKFAEFRTTYCPNESITYAAAEQWLQNAMANPESYLPEAVQAQIFGQDQARIIGERVRAQDANWAAAAARRFPLPPDVIQSLNLRIEQTAQDELAESSRKIAMLSVEMQKFSVEKILTLRTAMLDAAVKYVGALASGPEMATKLVGIGYDAQSKLISAASQFYNADTQAKEMVTKVQQYNNSLTFDAAVKNQGAEMDMIKVRVDAMMRDLQSLAQQATALFNNLHASVGLSTNGGTSLSTNPA